MPKVGNQTWSFPSLPRITATGTVAGKLESEGPLGSLFDIRYNDDRAGQTSWEKAEQTLFAEAVSKALQKADVDGQDVDILVGGDLNAQLSSFYFGLRQLEASSLGVYSACASICEALSVGALAIEARVAQTVVVGTSSHNSTAERQFRYPTEYGTQKPPSAQRTVTGAGAAVLTRGRGDIAITHATIGQVTDFGVTSPWEMNSAMAPAAASTIRAHLADTGRTFCDYDCVATGDLGFVGHDILHDLLKQEGIHADERLTDCGMLIYDRNQEDVFSGGSGGACCTVVTFAHLLQKLSAGTWKRVLVAATGALLSSVTAQQGESIPCISHAISFERVEVAKEVGL